MLPPETTLEGRLTADDLDSPDHQPSLRYGSAGHSRPLPAVSQIILTASGLLRQNEADYVTRRFNPESVRGWKAALRDLQIQLDP